MTWLKKIDEHFEEYLVIVLISIMCITAFAQVVFRFLIESSLDWSEELARYAFLWCMFISAGMAVKYRRHIKVEFGISWMPEKIRGFVEVLADLVWMAFCFFLIKDGVELLGYVKTQVSPSMEVPYQYIYLSLPAGAALMLIRLLQQMYRRFHRAAPDDGGKGR